MQQPVRIVIALILIALGILSWHILFPSPQTAIRSRLKNLAQVASFKPKDGNFARISKARHFPEFFTPDVVINVEIRGYGETTLTGIEQLQDAQRVVLNPQWIGGVDVELEDISVDVGADKRTAVANLTLKVTVEGQPDFIVKELNVSFKKVDRQWVIYRVDTVKTLSAAG
jgi:hypothetical protein